MRARWQLVQVWAATACLGLAAATPVVKVYLQSSWASPPFLLEALETLAMDRRGDFVGALNTISSYIGADPASQHWSEREQLEALHGELGRLETKSAQSSWDFHWATFEANLALHVAQPRLEAAFQHYRLHGAEIVSGEPPACDNWVLWRRNAYCDAKKLAFDMERTIDGNETMVHERPRLLPFDRILPPGLVGSSSVPPNQSDMAILYLSSFTPQQAELLTTLNTHRFTVEDFEVAVRYFPGAEKGTEKRRAASLGGYGVEMVLKRTDYLALDDRETGETVTSEDQAAVKAPKDSERGRSGLLSILGPDPWRLLETPLRPTEILDLGLRAASLVLSASSPLEALTQLSQDFPLYSAALARRYPLTAADEGLAQDIYSNQAALRTPPGYNGLWINGRAIRENEVDSFSLMEIVAAERELLSAFMETGMKADQAHAVLTDERIGAAMTEVDPMAGLVDASDRPEGGQVIMWWNNIEKDKRYANWSPGVSALLRPSRPGTFQQVRQNVWNVVLVLDLSQRISMQIISQTIGTLIQRGIPFRFGLVPLVGSKDDDSVKIARVIKHAFQFHGRKATIGFIADLFQAGPVQLPLDLVKQVYKHHFEDQEAASVIAGIVDGNSDEKAYIEHVREWASRVGASSEEGAIHGHVFFNGRHTDLTEMWTQQISQDYMAQLAYLASPAVAPEVKKLKRLSTYFYDLPTTSKRRNKYIVPDAVTNPLQLMTSHMSHWPSLGGPEQYIYPRESKTVSLTLRVLLDMNTPAGHVLAKAALNAVAQHDKVRLMLTHIAPNSGASCLDTLTSTAMYTLSHNGVLGLLSPVTLIDVLEVLSSQSNAADEAMARAFREAGKDFDPGWLDANCDGAQQGAYRAFKEVNGEGVGHAAIRDNAAHIIINGRRIGPVPAHAFVTGDFLALFAYHLSAGVQAVEDSLHTHFPASASRDRAQMADDILRISAVLASSYQPSDADLLMGRVVLPRRNMHDLVPSASTSFTLGERNSPSLRAFAIIDPLSEGAQKLSALLQMLSDLPFTEVTIVLSPALEMREIPIKRFYRYETGHRLTFDVDGQVAARGPAFQNLPAEPIFTMGMDVSASWLVAPRRSVHDLDNLRLEAIGRKGQINAVDINFELEHLIIDGHAKELNGSPPRGLQLQLHDLSGSPPMDTSVMANLGYFQFKAQPGLMKLEIRPGAGRRVYEVDTMVDAATGQAHRDGSVQLMSFRGLTLLPLLRRKPGMDAADVLALSSTSSASMSLWSRVSSSLRSFFGESAPPAPVNADINIFTVASGLLYERFASIMILSVMRHTNSTVKFWFIENFLSPSFLEFIPLLAEEYGFQYELVTYKWPSWLRAQKEKQRVIWGYKILFLDVLFPMTLDKVIFVDADQIVRTDLKELVHVDLRGRVYGYAPMGDDKPEMEGFRFWKQGYWRDALRGRPYHISALYVVDLKRFREEAAGDRLRAQYQALSQDPNSLANLDQDLPNSMQDTLPIFTLDQSWLWCETWCSQESLTRAKTIDLCQNPLTKEPKLARARAIPEWDLYDQEIATFARRIAERTQGLSGVGDAMGQGIDEMASVGAKPEGDVSGARKTDDDNSDAHDERPGSEAGDAGSSEEDPVPGTYAKDEL